MAKNIMTASQRAGWSTPRHQRKVAIDQGPSHSFGDPRGRQRDSHTGISMRDVRELAQPPAYAGTRGRAKNGITMTMLLKGAPWRSKAHKP